ncbi:hypothetical protein PA25_28650 [Pseudoalteromonas sp. A25]|uniref:hypothetical protein n=1 Tax=Pseudoalteromonas sp. A25 TaxID=116092 RepID=UPI00126081B3|nr:hypothetical protein [Pseudoalteromonas sp. A25]BBN82880.1 hypothetical protein PA25_28650 [Pseudoalteromonas sp. A25]
MFGELSLHFDTIVVLGFILAFALNVSFALLKVIKNYSLLITSGSMALSYFLSNHFYEAIRVATSPYLVWLVYDLVTMGCIWSCHKLFTAKPTLAYFYVMFGLMANSFMFIAMHFDRKVVENSEPWILWTIYSISINVFDLMMIAVLILNRDIFFIKFACKKLRGLLSKPFTYES